MGAGSEAAAATAGELSNDLIKHKTRRDSYGQASKSSLLCHCFVTSRWVMKGFTQAESSPRSEKLLVNWIDGGVCSLENRDVGEIKRIAVHKSDLGDPWWRIWQDSSLLEWSHGVSS